MGGILSSTPLCRGTRKPDETFPSKSSGETLVDRADCVAFRCQCTDRDNVRVFFPLVSAVTYASVAPKAAASQIRRADIPGLRYERKPRMVASWAAPAILV